MSVQDVCAKHSANYHLYADDNQLYRHVSIDGVDRERQQLGACVEDITTWCSSRRLQLNTTKTEFIWFGTAANLKKLAAIDNSLQVMGHSVQASSVVRDLGVQLDSHLTMKQHVNKVISIGFYHLRRLKRVMRYLSTGLSQQLISAFIFSKIDYCNSLLAGLPKSTMTSLQSLQHAAARVVLHLHPFSPIQPALRQLHWLPVERRVIFKLCLMMHRVHTGQCPTYIAELVEPVASPSSGRRLRSSYTAQYKIPRLRTKLGERAFSYAGPRAWNPLPPSLHQIQDTRIFKSQLKTLLFSAAN